MSVKGRRVPIEERFAGKFEIRADTGCWIWTSATAEGRYGVLWFADGRSKYAHRVSYEIHFGDIPNGMVICHTCDNGLCVNPDHLFVGTSKDNHADMMSKRRGPRMKGEANPSAKLTAEQAEEIKALKGGQLSQEAVGRQFSVSRGAIKNIWEGRTWKTGPSLSSIETKTIDWTCGTLSFGS